MKLSFTILAFITCSAVCFAEEKPTAAVSETLTPSIEANPPEDHTEIGMASKAIGIDFALLERRALGGDPDAIAVVVALTFDGGAGDMMAAIKTKILAECPADKIVGVLMNYSLEFRTKLIKQMRKDYLFFNGNEQSVKDEFDRKFGSLTATENKNNKKQNKSRLSNRP